MAGEKETEKKKKVSIYESGGTFDENLTIFEIEKTLHPRSKEVITEELSDLLGDLFKEHVDKKTGSIKDADKAADAFMEALAKYHFGEKYETLKSDKKHITETLRQKYGVSRTALKRAFKRVGAYKTIDSFYRSHMDPIVDTADKSKKQSAQESLDFYLKDENARGEVAEHMEKRTGKKLSKSYKAILDLDTTIQLIGNYMALPGAIEVIEKDKKATLNLPNAQAGHPSIYHAFEKGDEYANIFREEAKKVDSSHKLKYKRAVGF